MGGVTVRNAVDRYLAARRPFAAKATMKNYRFVLADLAHFMRDDFLVTYLREAHIIHWLDSKPLAPASVRVKLSIARGFSMWCVQHGLLKRDPCGTLKPPRQPEALPRELEPEAVEKTFLSVPDSRAALILSLMVQEGLRRAEVAALDVTDVDRLGRLLLVRQGKNRKDRWLPLTDETWLYLDQYLGEHPASSGPLIRSYNHPNRGITPNYVGKLVVDWMAAAGVKTSPRDGRSAHALRHTFAGAMLDDGADIRDVQQALGHANLGATYGYLRRRFAADRLRTVMGTRTYR